MGTLQSTCNSPLRVVQITDTHLYADPAGCLLGLNTQLTLDQILESIRERHWPMDVMLATGDLSHDGSPAAYTRLRMQLAALGAPVYCLPGNHDDPVQLGNLLEAGRIHTCSCVEHGTWGFIFLDSTRSGSEGGHLSGDALEQLRECVEQYRHRHVVLCLHHQPVLIGSRWLDTMAVDNAVSLFRVLDAAPHVRAIVWGHVHQAYDQERNGRRLLSCPSTCIQFLPGSAQFALDLTPPGYRWLNLYADGQIDTGIERLSAYPTELNIEASGY